MRHIISFCLLWICQIALFGQSGLGDDGNFNPSNPGDPQAPVLKHNISVEAFPVQGGSFNVTSEKVSEGSTITLYAYSNTGFVFKGWQQGDSLLSATSPYTYTMGNADTHIVGLFEYSPSSPENPGKNYWNAETGEVIVDDFTPGNLQSAVSSAIGGSSNRSKVTMITVSGQMTSNDFGLANNYTNCTLVDLKRSYGFTAIPSYGFNGNTTLASVVLPACVEEVGYSAFNGCSALADISCYAVVPPAVESYAFYGLPAGTVLHVLSSSIPLYAEAEGWKDFTILPLTEDVRALEVNLPTDAADGRYKNLTLELVNAQNGQKQKYVISDRTVYTFNGLLKNSSFNVYVKNAAGAVLGQLDGVAIADEDVSVTFDALRQPQDVSMVVLLPDGTDVTGQVQVRWFDAAGAYLSQGTKVSGQLPGDSLSSQIVLPQSLAMQYVQPEDSAYAVGEGGNAHVCTLVPFRSLTVEGRVKDLVSGMALQGAVVSVSQQLNGIYTKTFTGKTDARGGFSVTVYDAPSTVTASASDYLDASVEKADFSDTTFVGELALKPITGATVSLNFTYTPSVAEGETAEVQNWYEDYANVSYAIYNETQGRAITEFKVQYPSIVLQEEVQEGDKLRITASSMTKAFQPVEAEAVVDAANRASVSFPIVELGGIRASFDMTENSSVSGILYDTNGQLLKTYSYANAALSISGLADGEYTLVTMAESRLFNSILNLSQFAASGLAEGADYLADGVTVESGKVSAVSHDMVPVLDESKLYYTGDKTSFSVNKSSIVAGNYLTLKGQIDFKPEYASKVGDLKMVVDLPASCSFVENSVMVGSGVSSYTLDGSRLTIPVGRYGDQVRFCVIPTEGGSYAPSAFAQFVLDGKEVQQPIGNANYEVKDLSIVVPSTVARTSIPVSGTALSSSTIQVYDNGTLIGETTALANGMWSAVCELDNSYNLSSHEIYAKVEKKGMSLQSETKTVVFDKHAVEVSKVTMLNISHRVGNYYEEKTVFDFLTPAVSIPAYWYWPDYPDFTFLIDFTDNDTTLVSNVVLYVKTCNGNQVPLDAHYDSKKELWVANGKFGSWSNYDIPANVSVDFLYKSDALVDRKHFDSYIEALALKSDETVSILDTVSFMQAEMNAIAEKVLQDSIQYSIWEKEILQSGNGGAVLDSLLLLCLNQNSEKVYIAKDLEVVLPEFIDEAYVQNLIADTDKLLAEDGIVLDSLAIDALYGRFDALMDESDDVLDYMGSLQTAMEDTLTLETNGRVMTIYRTSLDSFNRLLIADCDTVFMDMTDGSMVEVYTSSDGRAYLIDQAKQEVWVVEQSQIVQNVRGLKTLASESNGFVSAMKSAINEINTLQNSLFNFLKGLMDDVNDEVTGLQRMISDMESERVVLVGQSAGMRNRITDLEKQIKRLSVNSIDDYFEVGRRQMLIDQLVKEREKCLADIKMYDKHIGRLESKVNGIKLRYVAKITVLGDLRDAYEAISGFVTLINYSWAAINDFNRWHSLINSIEPCENDAVRAASLKEACANDWSNIAWKKGYYPAVALSGISTGINTYMLGNKFGPGLIANVLIGIITDFMSNTATNMFTQAQNASTFNYGLRYAEYKSLKCKGDDDKDEDEDNNDGGGHGSNNPDVDGVHDPSGYVYEGVSSNRLPGVTATCYYKEMVEDMYGDLHENVVLWDAKEYAQENPLFTDENGMYRWDVPQGLWQVKFEKEGYQTTYSEWLPVPPPQLEVNIGMTQATQPEVKSAKAYEDGIEVEFDKYMLPETLTPENVFATKNGENVEGQVVMMDEEKAYEDTEATYASKVRFVPDVPFLTTDEVELTVSRKVKSYAGVQMEADFMQAFDIEKEVKALVADSLVKVAYNGSKSIVVSAQPYDAAIGKKLAVKPSSTMIISVSADTLLLDGNGQATLTVNGELPGASAISFMLVDGGVSCQSAVQVTAEALQQTATPTASRASGTAVYRGTEVELQCETENATIYYTVDGSCPCDENGTRQVYDAPIVINEEITLKAMAVSGELEDSPVAEFAYTLKKASVGLDLKEGWNWISHNLETDVPVEQAEEHAVRIVGQEIEKVKDPDYGWVGALNSLMPQKAYKLQAGEAARSIWEGIALNPATPFSVSAGWNWIGYTSEQSMTPDEAFAGTEPEEGDCIAGQEGFAQFADGQWTGTLQTLVPGAGYMYYSVGSKELAYNASIVSKANALYAKGLRKSPAPWAVDKYKYPNVMCVVADVFEDGHKVEAGTYAVGAFCGEECRGIGQYVDGKLMMSVYGEGGETITFKAAQDEVVYGIKETAIYGTDLLGNLRSPYVLTVGDDATGIAGTVTAGWNVWPTMVSTRLYVGRNGDVIDKLTLTDAYGATVMVCKDVASGHGIDVSRLADGVYIVTAVQGTDVFYKKIVKVSR